MSTAAVAEKPAPSAATPQKPMRREPWFAEWFFDRPNRRLFHEFERMFDELAAGWREPGELAGVRPALTPTIDAFAHGDTFVVRADLPGLTREQVRVEIADNVLTVQGERKLENKEEREGFYRAERREGQFLRRLPLPEGAVAGKATATFTNGVLEVRVPFAPHPEPPPPTRVEVR